MIGGLIAGAVGQWITNSYQQTLKEREMQVSTYKEYLAQGRDTVTKSYELIGGVISVTDDLISMMSTRESNLIINV